MSSTYVGGASPPPQSINSLGVSRFRLGTFYRVTIREPETR